MNALVPLAAPIVTLIGSIAALFGVWLTQKNNRETKLIELEHNRKLKEVEVEQQTEMRLIELQQEASRLFRSERQELYLELLTAIRPVRMFFRNVENAIQGGEQRQYAERLYEGLENYEALTPELEMSASTEVRHRADVYLRALYSCYQVLPEEEYYSEDEQVRREAAVRVTQRHKEEGVEEKYTQLLEQIRGEMAHFALHPNLMLDPAESKPTELE
jgi:hypothetical protein